MPSPPPSPIIGHGQPLRVLTAARESRRLAQAYLFAGPDGIGKRLIATRWAVAINCEAERPTGLPAGQAGSSVEFGGCGLCRSCRMALASTHPDLLLIEPDGQFIKIDQIRALQGALSLTAWSGTRKIAIIDRAERLNQEAANCLLKTLEEPPPESLLILVSAAADDLLPTLRSRCHLVRFFPLTQPQLAQWLVTERQWTQDDAALVSATAGGAVGKALAGDPTLLREERDGIDRWLADGCLEPIDARRALDRLVEGAEGAAQTAERFERALHWLRLWLQDVVRVAAAPAHVPLLRFPSARRAAELVPLEACSELATELHWMWRASFRNINRQLLLEQWLIALRDAVARTRQQPQESPAS